MTVFTNDTAYIEASNAIDAKVEAFLGDRRYKIAGRLPEFDATIEEIEASGLFEALSDKQAYLAWVAGYKALIKEISALGRDMRMSRKNQDLALYRLGEYKSRLASTATLLISLRRLGKRWSAEMARRAREEADVAA